MSGLHFFAKWVGVLDDREIGEFTSTDSIDVALGHGPRAAVIATPSATHLDVALAAAEAGCDLYIEKPLGHDLKDVDRLLAVVRERRLVAIVGCQYRFHPLFVELQYVIGRGQLGHIVGATAKYGDYLPSWHPWEDHQTSYSARYDLGGGAILTLAHPFDYLHALFGEWGKVQTMVARVPSLDMPAGEDWVDVNIKFSSGVIAHAHVDYLTIYVGNDVNDVSCLEAVGCAVVPADAHPSVRPHAHLVLT